MVFRVRAHLQAAYVLHTRPWSESSLLVDVFSQNHGRFRLLSKGARRRKTGASGTLIPFQPLVISWSGKSQGLWVLTSSEIAVVRSPLRGAALAAGYYANELLLKMLHREDAHESLFSVYDRLMQGLSAAEDTEAVLRRFECALLKEVGFGLILEHDTRTGEAIDPMASYYYYPELGPIKSADIDPATSDSSLLISGATLVNLANMTTGTDDSRREAKRLIRTLLNFYLGGQQLNSRRVYEAMVDTRRVHGKVSHTYINRAI